VELKPAIAPAYLKAGFFGATGTGKTFTATKIMAQFLKKYAPDSQLAMFDTEPSAGYVKDMVKKITGKELLAISSRSFSDLMEFTKLCIEKKYISVVDSITHPWRQLCGDYLEAKRSRVKGARGNPETVRLSLKDWGPLKDIWNQFSELFVYSPLHIAILGREGDVWENVIDEEGKEEMKKTGEKMKTETELGYEPSLLVRMILADTTGETVKQGHFAMVQKDRFDTLTGLLSGNNPDLAFFQPHINCLSIGGKVPEKSAGKKIFGNETGLNWETIKAQRAAILESIKDDLLLRYPGMTAEEKKAKVNALRSAFGTSAWTELEEDTTKWTPTTLNAGREKLAKIMEVKQ
jgi:hypothetical protein